MRVGGLADLKRWLWGRPAGDGLILLYHRVTEVNADPWGLCVSPQHFAEHLEVLRRHTQPIGLTGLVASVARRRVPRRAAVITLDDGYHDNLECAFPALARHGLPATYFLTTDVLPEGREFWWDELERLLLQPGKLPPTLTLTLDGQVCQWNFGAAVDYRDNDARQHRDWRTWHAAPTARHEIYFSLWHQLYRLAEAEKRRVLDELMVWAGATPANRGTHRCLSVPEIAQLAASDLVEIGAHSVTHSGLPQLPLLKQRSGDSLQPSPAARNHGPTADELLLSPRTPRRSDFGSGAGGGFPLRLHHDPQSCGHRFRPISTATDAGVGLGR